MFCCSLEMVIKTLGLKNLMALFLYGVKFLNFTCFSSILFILTSNEHILTEYQPQIVEVVVTSVWMSCPGHDAVHYFCHLVMNVKAYLTLAPFTVVSAYS